MGKKVLLIADNDKRSKKIAEKLSDGEYTVKKVGISEYAAILAMESPDAVVLHLVDAKDGAEEECLDEIKSFDDALPVIIVSAGNKIRHAVSLMKAGAYDYFESSDEAEKISISVANAVRLYNLTKRVYLLEQQSGWVGHFDNIIGQSAKMQDIFQMISTVAKSNATVLILGDSGTGKELVAKAIHKYSARAGRPFVDINCGAIPRELLENELFGHEKGSYTGADKRYIGSCERAHGGTLFLDEICEMDASLQVKILRLLQERSFNRVGGVGKITADIRFIAATNKNIEDEVKKGNFREDLYYRLNVVPIQIPPLRDRKEDILQIARHFLEKFSTKNEKIFVDIDPAAGEALLQYDWPGNVRELENMIERIVVLNNDTYMKTKHLPEIIQEAGKERKIRTPARVSPADVQKIVPLDLVEKYAIESALVKCAGNVCEAAKRLRIGQATLYRKIKQYGLT